jgi:hypothetical protein
MKRLLLAAALALLAMFKPVHAAEISYPASITGKWCQADIKSEADGWIFFRRGKCTAETSETLMLKKNGDYVLAWTGGHEHRCKANPKSYFKGWTDYTCNQGPKRTQKFTIDEQTQTLGLSTTETE